MGRISLALSVALLLSPLSALFAQDRQTPVFRSSVDVLEVDVNVVDSNGRPIPDLRAPDFNVTVEGQSRTVLSSQFVRDDSSDPAAAAYKPDPYVASNIGRPHGRLIIIAIDQNNITAGRARDLVMSVRKFIAALPGADRVAVVALPAPGPAVDFTTNRERIYDALPGIRGTDDGHLERYDIGDLEAIAVVSRGDEIVIRRLLERECRSVTDQDLRQRHRARVVAHFPADPHAKFSDGRVAHGTVRRGDHRRTWYLHSPVRCDRRRRQSGQHRAPSAGLSDGDRECCCGGFDARAGAGGIEPCASARGDEYASRTANWPPLPSSCRTARSYSTR